MKEKPNKNNDNKINIDIKVDNKNKDNEININNSIKLDENEENKEVIIPKEEGKNGELKSNFKLKKK